LTEQAGQDGLSMTQMLRLPDPGTARMGSSNPWNALWAMMVGFFMIMVDSTIVVIANPTIMTDLHMGYESVVWVTSAYLLGFAVVMLVAGRLGDRFGTLNLYLIGLAVFTVASLWCGLAGSAAMLIAARVVQGVGAGVLTPQTLSTITRIFPPQRRGVAMSVWGATAGVATLVGPLAGGVLVDGLGWEWIFFVNVPIGLAGLALAFLLVPALPTQMHGFDLIGVALSGVGLFLVVFGLQQGQAAHWQPWIWAMIVGGIGFLTTFVYWQSVNTREPLIPLDIFGDRDFSLCSAGVAIVGFAVTAMMLPLTFYLQGACGLSPTRSALLLAPLAIANGGLAPFVGRIVDRYHPRPVLGFGFSMLAIGLTWLSFEMAPETPIWRLLLPLAAIGVGMAFVWSPLTATATRHVPPELAGASSGVYNTIRQLGSVLGSAGMAAFMPSRISAEMPWLSDAAGASGGPGESGEGLALPEFVRDPFSAAMAQSMLLPAFVALFGIVAAIFLVGFSTRRAAGVPDADPGYEPGYGEDPDDDEYVEFILRRDSDPRGEPEGDTEPLAPRLGQPQPPPAEAWHTDPVESWHSLLTEPEPSNELIGFAHNGSHVTGERHGRPLAEVAPPVLRPDPRGRRPARRRQDEPAPRPVGEGGRARNRHYRPDPEGPVDRGRHASP
jgi:EmrB/QacA subfamily drug resistance transporter